MDIRRVISLLVVMFVGFAPFNSKVFAGKTIALHRYGYRNTYVGQRAQGNNSASGHLFS
jgi:hypothetical protein